MKTGARTDHYPAGSVFQKGVQSLPAYGKGMGYGSSVLRFTAAGRRIEQAVHPDIWKESFLMENIEKQFHLSPS